MLCTPPALPIVSCFIHVTLHTVSSSHMFPRHIFKNWRDPCFVSVKCFSPGQSLGSLMIRIWGKEMLGRLMSPQIYSDAAETLGWYNNAINDFNKVLLFSWRIIQVNLLNSFFQPFGREHFEQYLEKIAFEEIMNKACITLHEPILASNRNH